MNLQKFIQDNTWGIIVGAISLTILITFLRSTVNANTENLVRLDTRVTALENLVVKVAVQDEKINTIGQDVKEIKKALNIN